MSSNYFTTPNKYHKGVILLKVVFSVVKNSRSQVSMLLVIDLRIKNK